MKIRIAPFQNFKYIFLRGAPFGALRSLRLRERGGGFVIIDYKTFRFESSKENKETAGEIFRENR